VSGTSQARDLADGFEVLRRRFLALTGIDLDGYRGAQLERRLGAFLARRGFPDVAALAVALEADPALLEEFRNYLTINVSEFFRNPDRFEELRNRILPELLARSPVLRIWSAGCSIGAEIYSVAMILAELTPGRRHYLVGTDIDRPVLERARRAVFTEQEVRLVPERLLRRFFQVGQDGAYHLDRRLAETVEFRYHNLLRDPLLADMDLILCRNVVIYFTEEAKERLYRGFRDSLRPGGYLFLGGTEMIFNARHLGLEPVSPCFYRKVESREGSVR